jgi:hypothetical protein
MYQRCISKEKDHMNQEPEYHSYLSDTFLKIPPTNMPVVVKVHASTVELGDILLHALISLSLFNRKP